jgi:hypothetical protein
MHLAHLLFGKPLASEESGRERIGSLTGVSLLGLDALASAAYGPEALLTVLKALVSAALAQPQRVADQSLVALSRWSADRDRERPLVCTRLAAGAQAAAVARVVSGCPCLPALPGSATGYRRRSYGSRP